MIWQFSDLMQGIIFLNEPLKSDIYKSYIEDKLRIIRSIEIAELFCAWLSKRQLYESM